MTKRTGCFSISVCIIAIAFGIFVTQAFAAEITVTGTVYGNYEIETDNGEIYTITADTIGDELVELDGARVIVSGEIDDTGGGKVLTVSSYKVIEEGSQEESPSDTDQRE